MRFFRDSSIERKLTIVVFLTCVLGLSVAGVAFELFERARFRSSLATELTAYADTLGQNTAAAVIFNDHKTAQDLLSALRVERNVMAACLYDNQGRVFAEYRREGLRKAFELPPWQGGAVRFAPDALTVSRSFSLDAEKAGGIAIVSDFSQLHDKMMQFREVSAMILIVSILFIALLSSRLVRLMTEPILQLAMVARNVTAREDYSVRAIAVGEDEVGELVASFNQMLERIQERDAALQEANEVLELRVEARTQELQSEIAQRAQAEEALSLERERLRALIDNVPDYMYVKDVECRFLVANLSVARQMGGSSPDELLGKSDFDFYPREIAETFFNDERRVILSGQPEVNREEVGLDPQGNVSRVLTTQVPLRDKHGRVIGLAGVGRDISALKRAQEDMRKAREAAEAASRAKSEFLANMSHEIRTPLNGVIGMTDLALETELTADQREYLETVKLSADSLLTVINDILDFSKIEAGKIDFEAVDFSLRDCLESTLKIIALRAHQKGLELLCEIAPDVPEWLQGDASRLRQVIVNLVGNAVKFTERGEVAVRVGLDRRDDHAYLLRFTVTDTGIGIPKEKLDSIFAPFNQADTSTTRKYGGTGLGLTISTRLVAMMGGAMWVESEAGKGSRFYFTVHLKRAEAPLEKVAIPASPEILRGLRVLVVDDNETNRRILEGMLSRWEMLPTPAGSGEEALAQLATALVAKKPFDLILTDCHMPTMDGFVLVESIRKRPEFSAATIMMLTSAGHRDEAARCHELGVAAYLLKPVRQSELREAIIQVLGTSRRIASIPLAAPTVSNDRAELRETLRILVAEDNLVNQKLVAKLLEKRGHTVTMAATGRAALAVLQQQPFDLVLMDLQMPEMDGFEATAEIRRREREAGSGGGVGCGEGRGHGGGNGGGIGNENGSGMGSGRHLPIVALTAHAMKGDREKCIAAGMDSYLTKPIRPQELDAVLDRYCGRSPRNAVDLATADARK